MRVCKFTSVVGHDGEKDKTKVSRAAVLMSCLVDKLFKYYCIRTGKYHIPS